MLKLAEVFGDGMVLQRRKPIRIWGNSEEAQKLSVSLNGITVAEADAEGAFEMILPAQEALEDATLKIRGSLGDELEIKRVDIGEVWIAGGQSNMEFNLRFDAQGDAMIAAADDAHFRFYDVGRYAFFGEREEALKPDRIHWDKWVTYCPADAPWFSAVGVHFALRLREQLGVPVGIVGCNWGGTTASAWLDEALLKEDEKLSVYTDVYEKTLNRINLDKYRKKNRRDRELAASEKSVQDGDILMKIERTQAPTLKERVVGKFIDKFKPVGPHSEKRPGGLYQTMLKKIAGYTCSGVIWYQGESDENYATLYAKLFTKMIECWRRDWGEELPFLFTQLAPFESWLFCSGENYPVVREQQQMVENELEGAWMASIMDVGSRYDIHPKEKSEVGKRLAYLALNKVYGMDLECHAPMLKEIVREGDKLVVSFDYAKGGLVERECADKFSGLPRLFEVRAGGGKLSFVAKVNGGTVELSSPDFAKEKTLEVRFAYQPYCCVNLYAKSGLPVRPFRAVADYKRMPNAKS